MNCKICRYFYGNKCLYNKCVFKDPKILEWKRNHKTKKSYRNRKKTLKKLVIPNPPSCICGNNDFIFWFDVERENVVAKCKKCGFSRVFSNEKWKTSLFNMKM